MHASSFAESRALMVARQLRDRGIHDERVLRAMGSIPREDFVPPEFADRAYADGPLEIGCGQTISQPYMVAVMTEALAPDPGDRVLEIGTGSGYQAAVLAQLVAQVISIERYQALAEVARRRLARLGVDNVEVIGADGSGGWPQGAPYNGIIVTAAAPEIPDALIEQLGEGGRLVIPVGSRRRQMCTVVTKLRDKTITRELTACVFVPLYGKHGWAE